MGIVVYNKSGSYTGFIGNRMFQAASSIGIAKKNCMDYAFVPCEYFQYFEGPFPKFINCEPIIDISEANYHYDRIILDRIMNYNLSGYFQSAKYWEGYETLIKDLFRFKCEEHIRQKYNHLLSLNPVSIHVRRGDYLKYPDHHPVLPFEYYNKAISQFEKTTHFLVFSDDPEWCEKHFIASNFTIIKDNHFSEDMCLMSLCSHNIIANSSFSWWASYLNKNTSKKVIAPAKHRWYGPAYSNWNLDDLYLPNWILL